MIYKELDENLNNPYNVSYKKVQKYPKYKWARKGKYRICFKVSNNCVYIGRIEDRSKVYN